jgi:GT2 family glycosyltransferase
VPDIALLVLNWNGADLLERHLPAVVEAARSATPETTVHVIDNASTDASREVVARFEGVEFIARPDNRKLHAYNDVVPGLDCDAFMMLNNDLSPSPNSVDTSATPSARPPRSSTPWPGSSSSPTSSAGTPKRPSRPTSSAPMSSMP